MNKKLIKTGTIWYKIKSSFNTNKNDFINESSSIEKSKAQTFINALSVKGEIENQNRRKVIAERIIKKEIYIYDLKDEEKDEMTDYFTEDIRKIDKELLRIKNHIKKMKQELNN